MSLIIYAQGRCLHSGSTQGWTRDLGAFPSEREREREREVPQHAPVRGLLFLTGLAYSSFLPSACRSGCSSVRYSLT